MPKNLDARVGYTKLKCPKCGTLGGYFSKNAQKKGGKCRKCASTSPDNVIQASRVESFLSKNPHIADLPKAILGIVLLYSGHVKLYTSSPEKQLALNKLYRAMNNIGRLVSLARNKKLMQQVRAARKIYHRYKEHKLGKITTVNERMCMFIHNHRIGNNEEGQGSCVVCWYNRVKKTRTSSFKCALWHCSKDINHMSVLHLCDEHVGCDPYRCSFRGCTNLAPKMGFCCCHVDERDRVTPMPDIYGDKKPEKCDFGKSSKALPGESCDTMTVHGYCIKHWKVRDSRLRAF